MEDMAMQIARDRLNHLCYKLMGYPRFLRWVKMRCGPGRLKKAIMP